MVQNYCVKVSGNERKIIKRESLGIENILVPAEAESRDWLLDKLLTEVVEQLWKPFFYYK